MRNIFNFIYRHRLDLLSAFILFALIFFTFIIFPKEETKNIINILENKTFDIRQNIIAKDKHVNKDIVIVTVDDPSYEYLIEEYGDWPIPRNVHAQILNFIQEQKPKYVAFDFMFIKSLNRIPNSDNLLIESFKKYKDNTYTAINFDDYSYELRKPPILDPKLKSNIKFNSNKILPERFSNCRPILNELIQVTENIGHINTPKSDDGFIRSIPAIINYPKFNNDNYNEYEDNYYLYMTIKLAIDYLNKYENANIKELVVDSNNNLILGNRKIPLTNDAQVILNWYGETGVESDKTFQYVSFWKVLKSMQAKEQGLKPLLPDNFFNNKFVYIGTNVFSLSDIKTVPTSKYLPGVEIHATLLNNILDNNLIHKASVPYNIIITVVLTLMAVFTVFKIRSVYISVCFFILFTGLYLYFSTYVMTKYNVWVWIIIPVAVSIFAFVCSFLIKYLLKSRDFEYTYKLATTDGLTELYNHRFFQEQLRLNIKKSDKTKIPFSLIIIDIDFFKKFNDKYGHQAGDAVLKHVAKTLKSCVRNEDFVCRYGGEEMTIILNNTNRDTAVRIANNICNTISSREYELNPDLSVNITISLGVATYPVNANTPTALIEYADKCLYNAKENGRNRVGFIE